MKIEFVNAEILRIGPGEVLLVKVPGHLLPPDPPAVELLRERLNEHLSKILEDRYILVLGDLELGVVSA